MKKKYSFAISSVICGLTLILVLIPLVICLINSFRTTSDLMRGFVAVPESITIENYEYIINNRGALRYLMNSLLITSVGVLISFLINPFVSYMIAINWRKKKYRFLYTFLSHPYIEH